MGAVDFSLDPALVEALKSALPLEAFVETGTFEGDTISRLLGTFAEIHSIEVAEGYFETAAARFAGESNVHLHHGDSRDVLAGLRRSLDAKSVLYWLDAHWCDAADVGGAELQCPLLGELAALDRLNSESAILIDDARLFLAPPPSPHVAPKWPRFVEIWQQLRSLGASHELMVVNDVIAFFPPAALAAVSEYARAHGADWHPERHDRALQAQSGVIAELEHERGLQTRAAAERLEVIEDLERERDTLAAAVGERDLVIAALELERELQTGVAAERLEALEALERESTVRLRALEELASQRFYSNS
jgi:hypothetical protein